MGLPNEVSSALIGAANQGGYTINQSLRFNGGGPTRLTYDNTSGTNNSSSAWTLSFWMKRGSDIFNSDNGNDLHLMMWTPSGSCSNTEYFLIADPNHGTTSIRNCMSFNGGGFSGNAINKLRDPAAWYHFVWRGNTGVYSNTIYINGVAVTAYNQGPSTMTSTYINGASRWSIGDSYTGCSSSPWDGHLAEVHFVDGQTLDPTSFGEYDDNGVWRPIKYTGTYGTNGYYLKFDPSATNGVGHDHSGNGHHWTATNVSTSGTDTDISDDTPTNNFATFNPLAHDTGLGEGNTAIVTGHGNADFIWTKTIGANGTGNYYWEYTLTSVQASSDFYFGVVEYTKPIHRLPDWTYGVREKLLAYNTASGNVQWRVRDTLVNGNAPAAPSGGWTVAVNDVIGVRLDIDNDLITISKNGTVQTGLSGYLSSDSTVYYTPATDFYGNNDAGYFNAGQRDFSHQPTGTSALSTATLPEADVVDPREHFQVLLGPGEGTGSSASITEQYKTSDSSDSPTATYQDLIYGKPATDLGASDGVHPVFFWASQLSLGGYDDWYIPARYELEILYRALKPTTTNNSTNTGANPNAVPATSNYTTSSPAQTSVTAFQSGGAQALTSTEYYWSSSENSSNTGNAYAIDPNDGTLATTGRKSLNFYARAIRRVAYTGSEPSVGASYQGGYFYGLIDAKSSPDGTATHALIVAPKNGGDYGVATGILDIAQRTFSSGLWWIKDRENANQNQIFDTASTSSSVLLSPANGRASYSNPSGSSVAWCWAAPSSSVSNTNGSVTTNVYANDTAGFSIATWSGTGVNATVGHGLSSAPEIVWVTNSNSSAAQMQIGSNYLTSWGYYLELNVDNAETNSNGQPRWNNTAPTSTVVNVGNGNNVSGRTMYMYSWRTVPGYSSIGSYIGNGDGSQGTFVYTGFRVRWLMVKALDTGQPWLIYDTERDTYNPSIRLIKASATQAESADTDSSHDHLSNGFIWYTSTPGLNGGTNKYLYMAFAQHPFGGSNVTPSPAAL